MARVSRLRGLQVAWLGVALVLLHSSLAAARPSRAPRPPNSPPANFAPDPNWRTAVEFLRGAPADARRALCNAPGSRPGLCGLGQVLSRGQLPRPLLLQLVSNPHASPYLVNTFRALAHVDQVQGVPTVLERMARGRNDGSVRGASFEIVAGACLGGRLRQLGVTIGGNEVDGVLDDGTVVEMKDRHHAFIGKVRSQLTLRCAPGSPSMLVLPMDPDADQLSSLRRVAETTGGRFSVVVADPLTLTARTVLSVDGRRPVTRNAAPLRGPVVPRATPGTGRR